MMESKNSRTSSSLAKDETGEGRRRVFLAIPLFSHETAVEKFVKVLDQLELRGFSGKRSSPRQAHFTLLFLGDRESREIEQICRAASETARAIAHFSLLSRGIAGFSKRPRLLFLDWVSEPADAYVDLVFQLNNNMGSKIELESKNMNRQPRPHTTLIRFRRASDRAPLKLMKAVQTEDRQVWQWPELEDAVSPMTLWCKYFCLYQSVLTPQGPVYTELARFELAATTEKKS